MDLYYTELINGDGRKTVRSLLKYAVKTSFNIEAPEIKKDKWGKPYFEECSHIHFSLSHGKTHVLCGVDTMPLGVDVETIRPLRPGVRERVCASQELAVFDFFDLWVLKESYIKCLGHTNLSLNQIIFSKKSSSPAKPACPLPHLTCSIFKDFPGCSAVLCCENNNIPDSITYVNSSGLIFFT